MWINFYFFRRFDIYYCSTYIDSTSSYHHFQNLKTWNRRKQDLDQPFYLLSFSFSCGDLFLSLIQTYIPSMTSHNTLFIQSKTCNYILSRDRNNCNILAVLYIIFIIFSSPPATIPRRLWEFNLTLPRSGRLISLVPYVLRPHPSSINVNFYLRPSRSCLPWDEGVHRHAQCAASNWHPKFHSKRSS